MIFKESDTIFGVLTNFDKGKMDSSSMSLSLRGEENNNKKINREIEE